MPRLELWHGGRKTADYRYIDRAVAEWFGISGTGVYVHLFIGTHGQGANAPDLAANKIQDVLLLENRDRKYSKEIYDLRGVYNMSDMDFDLRQFGMFLSNDSLFVEFHANDMVAQLGRRLMSGDVLEFPHLRDDATLDGSLDNAPAINKFYVVEDVNRASDGYSPTWFSHILRVKCAPMAAAEEYDDILNSQAKDTFGFDSGVIRDLMTTYGKENGINDAVVAAATANVTGRNFETRQFYVIPGEETLGQNPWIFAGDGIPPNGAALVGSGNSFPTSPAENDYYLRLDYSPHALFRRLSGKWRIQEQDYREGEWSAAARILKSFINNNTVTTNNDGSTAPEKQSLFQAVKPKGDFT
jgi:hypothetical protein